MDSEKRLGYGCCSLMVLLVLAVPAFTLLHHKSDLTNYEKGHQAYLQADCSTAINYYERALNTLTFFNYGDFRTDAGAELLACRVFLEGGAKQEAGDLSSALQAYNNFLSDYKSSPLFEPAQEKVAIIYQENKPAEYLSEDLCKELDQFVDLKLIPQPDTYLPQLYYGCGQLYEKSESFSIAIDYYEIFLSLYKNLPLAPEVNTALMRAIVARAKLGGGAKLPAPEQSGTTTDGSTLVIVRNASPESLRIVFSGAENRIEELESCSSCSTYISSPPWCPTDVPVGRYILKPGQYFVVVESTSDKSISSWSGGWALEGGLEYTNCFYIIKTYKFGN